MLTPTLTLTLAPTLTLTLALALDLALALTLTLAPIPTLTLSLILDGSWSYPSIPAIKFEGVPPTGWATELSGAVVRVLDQSGELMTVKVPAHPEDPASAHLYRDVPTSKFNGGYRKESRYVRLLCIDFRQSPPVIHKVPQFSSTPPQTMASCI